MMECMDNMGFTVNSRENILKYFRENCDYQGKVCHIVKLSKICTGTINNVEFVRQCDWLGNPH